MIINLKKEQLLDRMYVLTDGVEVYQIAFFQQLAEVDEANRLARQVGRQYEDSFFEWVKITTP